MGSQLSLPSRQLFLLSLTEDFFVFFFGQLYDEWIKIFQHYSNLSSLNLFIYVLGEITGKRNKCCSEWWRWSLKLRNIFCFSDVRQMPKVSNQQNYLMEVKHKSRISPHTRFVFFNFLSELFICPSDVTMF